MHEGRARHDAPFQIQYLNLFLIACCKRMCEGSLLLVYRCRRRRRRSTPRRVTPPWALVAQYAVASTLPPLSATRSAGSRERMKALPVTLLVNSWLRATEKEMIRPERKIFIYLVGLLDLDFTAGSGVEGLPRNFDIVVRQKKQQ